MTFPVGGTTPTMPWWVRWMPLEALTVAHRIAPPGLEPGLA
jgi:hypothetical protein